MRLQMVGATMVAVGLLGCAGEVADPVGRSDGLYVNEQSDTRVSGVLAQGGVELGFIAEVSEGMMDLRFTDARHRRELLRVHMAADGRSYLDIRSAGEQVNLEAGFDGAPQLLEMLRGEHGELIGGLWRELEDRAPEVKSLAAGDALHKYSLHILEVQGTFDPVSGDPALGDALGAEAPPAADADTEAHHRSGSCFGCCGPSCWGCTGVYTNYCKCHDSCCDHNGSWACFTWCYWDAYSWCNI